MKLTDVTQAFIEGRYKRGCDMNVSVDGDTTRLTYGSRVLAEITDRQEDSFTLTLFSTAYGCIALSNRLSAIFQAISKTWTDHRYSSFVRWGSVKLWDRKLSLELAITRNLRFTVSGVRVQLDYEALEDTLIEDKTPVLRSSHTATSNSNQSINELRALIATI